MCFAVTNLLARGLLAPAASAGMNSGASHCSSRPAFRVASATGTLPATEVISATRISVALSASTKASASSTPGSVSMASQWVLMLLKIRSQMGHRYSSSVP